MNRFTLIQFEWNSWNGVILNLFNVEIGNFEGALFGLNFSKQFIVLQILFMEFSSLKDDL